MLYFLFKSFFFFFFFEHRLSTPVGIPNLSMQVKIQPTYLTLGVDFCVYGPCLSHHKGNHSPTSGAVETFWKKNRLKITGGRNKKRILENKKRVWQERGTPNYLRTENLIAPVVPKTGEAFNFNPQCPTAGIQNSICKVFQPRAGPAPPPKTNTSTQCLSHKFIHKKLTCNFFKLFIN